MKKLLSIIAVMVLAFVGAPVATASEAGEHDGKLDPKEIIFEHLGDGYGWEVPFNHHKRIPLPCIVIGKDGLHIFSSSRIADGKTYVDGNVEFKVAGHDSKYKGKIVEIVDGHEEKPIDLSITKNVCAVFITVFVVIAMMFAVARFHRRNAYRAPRKGLGALESLIVFIYDSVVKETLGDKAKKFAPYLLTVFFFIFTGAYGGLPRRRESDRQYRRNPCALDYHFPCDKPVCHKTLLERDFLARRASLAQIPPADHARNRDIRYVHEAGGTHSASLRKHDGRPHDSHRADIADLYLRSGKSGCRWCDNSGVGTLLDIHAPH